MTKINDKEDHDQLDIKQSEKTEATGKIYVKQPHEILKDSSLNSTNDDVQRAIEGLREIPDEELQEFLDEEDFMEGLNVVDAWEGDEDRNRDVEQDTKESKTERKERRPSRERHRVEPKGREKPKREEKKREEMRRDPLKSTKDIERDKIRTKRDTESKLLAEKEKAIKHLLDSDNVVPPGTETEAIQSITEEQNRERAQREAQRSREHRRNKSLERYRSSPVLRRRTPDRSRLSPHRRRSPFIISPERRRSPFRASTDKHRSPLKYSPGRRKNSPRYFSDRRSPNLSPDRRRSPRRLSGERRSSIDRKWSPERLRRKRPEWIHERRRSRSRDRRSRSTDRPRRRSRSPASRRYSPCRRSHSRTRSRSLEKHVRKRSPFINELARQFGNEAMIPSGVNSGGYVPSATMEGIAPLLNPLVYQQETESRQPPPPPPPPSVASTYVHQPGSLPPPPPPSSLLPMSSGPSFIGFESMPSVLPMNFESMSLPHTLPPAEYSSAPVMYNQPNAPPIQAPTPLSTICPLLPTSLPSPQPVPAPIMDHAQIPYNPSHNMSSVRRSPIRQYESSNTCSNHSTVPSTSSQTYTERGSTTSYNKFHAPHEERVKTPEPPVISKPKQSEKTSLSSLLEASVSAKDPSNIPVLYPGFKPEIMRHCEQALCQLPFEDPRLKMKGRFFYDRNEEDNTKTDSEDHTSNSILLQKSKTKTFWEETNAEQQILIPKAATQMHQKICQTDELETETKGVQVCVTMVDVGTQIYQHDLVQIKEEKRPIMDRLDWNVRESNEYASRFRETDDLRWSLSNSSQRRSWNRQTSPSRRSDEYDEHRLESTDHGSRSMRRNSPVRSRENFSTHKVREHYGQNRHSPEYHRRSMEHDDFHEKKSNHSRGESPMELDESDDEIIPGYTFPKESDWHGREKIVRGKGHILKGKHSGGRPYRGRGNFRGKF